MYGLYGVPYLCMHASLWVRHATYSGSPPVKESLRVVKELLSPRPFSDSPASTPSRIGVSIGEACIFPHIFLTFSIPRDPRGIRVTVSSIQVGFLDPLSFLFRLKAPLAHLVGAFSLPQVWYANYPFTNLDVLETATSSKH